MTANSISRTGNAALPLGLLKRIDDVCARFEAVWAAGGDPSLESFLALVPEPGRARLFEELVRTEWELRAQRGEAWSAAALRQRFPGRADLLDRVLAELNHQAPTSAFPGVPARGRATAVETRVNAAPVTTMHHERPPAPPTPVEGYEIVKELGRGGMGVVYLARHLKLQRLVALKVILAGDMSTPAQQERFRAEALAVARLKHPNLVQIYAGGQHKGQPFLALEYVEGGSLEARLDGLPQTPQTAARFLTLVASAVHAVHQKGIVHRDLKPANILLDEADSATRPLDHCTPKISDFGLAKNLQEAAGDRLVKTRTGVVMGTPAYMSPEQARGAAVGVATDIYALGAILYEMLTGRPPFQGASALDTLNLICKEEPVPPRRLQSQCPRDLETICLKCLDKEPARRYASARELGEDLEAYLGHRPLKARPVGALGRARRWTRRNPVVSALLAAVVLLLLGGTAVASVFAVQANRAAAAATDRAQSEARERRRAEWLAYANQVCLAQREFERGMIPKARMILDACPQEMRAWEHDYLSHLVLHGRQPLNQSTVANGLSVHVLAATRRAVSPDGQQLAVCVGPDIQVWSKADGVLLRTLRGHAGAVRCLVYSPDNKRLISGGDDATVKVWEAADGQQLLTLEGHRSAVTGVVFSPDGSRLVSADAAGVVQLWNTQPAQ